VFQLSKEVTKKKKKKIFLPLVLKYAAKDFPNIIFPQPSTITTPLFLIRNLIQASLILHQGYVPKSITPTEHKIPN
jgi:hypothetical protein